MRLEQYLTETTITYEQYCGFIDSITVTNEGIISDLKDKAYDLLSKSFSVVKDELLYISQEIGVGINDILDALKSKDAYSIISSIGFNLKVLFRSLVAATSVLNKGILELFRELHKSKIVQKIHSGVMTVDEVLDKYPLLKRCTGPVIAGLLFYLWLNMSFTGKFDADFDISDVINALRGQFTISDIISTPEGLMRLFLLLTGPTISFTWLSSSMMNVMMAVLFTATAKTNHPVTVKVRSKISKHMERL